MGGGSRMRWGVMCGHVGGHVKRSFSFDLWMRCTFCHRAGVETLCNTKNNFGQLWGLSDIGKCGPQVVMLRRCAP